MEIEESHARAIGKAVEQIHSSLLHTKGVTGTPDKERIRQDLEFFFETVIDHEDFKEQEFFSLSGFWIRIERSHSHWINFTAYVPATERLIWMKDRED